MQETPSDSPSGEDDPAPIRRRGMRTGYTTGACAAAAATAATIALCTGVAPVEATVTLPAGRQVVFSLARCELEAGTALASVIKDAGDDPDVTHGAEIRARVWRTAEPGLSLRRGEGVGLVTRAGLGLEIGGPAINPVPRRMIGEHVLAALREATGQGWDERGVAVEVSIPNGETLARKTLNGRLGIIGGLSILGTTGIVRPYSTASWRASVVQAIDVAAANGCAHIVLSTGGRSEKYARAILPDLPELAFVEMGIFTGAALKQCRKRGARRVTLAGMIGKFSKIAQGHFQTHVAGNQVDPDFLASLLAELGAPAAVLGQVRGANTARHAQELATEHGLLGLFPLLCQQVARVSRAEAGLAFAVEAILFDFDGSVLGRASTDA